MSEQCYAAPAFPCLHLTIVNGDGLSDCLDRRFRVGFQCVILDRRDVLLILRASNLCLRDQKRLLLLETVNAITLTLELSPCRPLT